MNADLQPSTPVHLSALRDWCARLFVKQGMFAAEAEIAALRLIESELMGRPAGGLRWLPRLISALDLGDIDPRARMVTAVDLPALAVIDGSTALGQVAVTHALKLAAQKAQTVGSATVVVKNSRPVGDPTSCLAVATAAGCVASVMTTCKPQTDPWPIGPCTVLGWPGTDRPLSCASAPPSMSGDVSADVLTAALGGRKTSGVKKKLFTDDAEFVCTVIAPSTCVSREQFLEVAGQVANVLCPPAWVFDPGQWPVTVELISPTVAELRELAVSARLAAEW